MHFGSPPPLAATLSRRAISVGSLSKTYGLPGIRIGWLITRDRELRDRFVAAKEQILITNSVVDEAIAEVALAARAERLPRIKAGIKAAFETTRAWIGSDPRFEWVEPQGGVVSFPRVARAAGPFDVAGFHRILLQDHGAVVGPGHWFGQPAAHFRLGYAWPTPSQLSAGLAGLSAALSTVLDEHAAAS
jgi:aspartate/methionine/tyrosine aminotransferase